MMCFMDTTFCASKVKKHTCGRELTEELKTQAEKWWGSKDYPVVFMNFCDKPKSKDSK